MELQQNNTSDRPALVSAGMWLSGCFGVVLVLGIVGAAIGIGQFSIGEESVTGHEFLRQAGINLAIFAVILLGVSFGVANAKPWSRYLMILFWLAVGGVQVGEFVAGLRDGESRGFDLTWIPAAAVAAWYLFGKKNVAAYYRALEQREGSYDEVRRPD